MPRTRRPTELARTLLQGLLAVLAIAALVALPPVALLYLARSQEMLDTVASVALWSAWTLLVSGLIVEVVEAVAGRLGRTTHLPHVGGPLRLVARWLVASLVAAAGVFGLAPSPASARQALPAGDEAVAGTLALPAAYLPADQHDAPVEEPTSDIPADYDGETAHGTLAGQEEEPVDESLGDDLPADEDSQVVEDTQPVEVTVEPGDNFWVLAERELSDAWGRIPTDAEVAPYWQTFVDDNFDRLLPPEDPDLIYPGQVLVPPPAPPHPAGNPGATATANRDSDSSDAEPASGEDATEDAASAEETANEATSGSEPGSPSAPAAEASEDQRATEPTELNEEPAASTEDEALPQDSLADEVPQEPTEEDLEGYEPPSETEGLDEPAGDTEASEEPTGDTEEPTEEDLEGYEPPPETEGLDEPADAETGGSATGPQAATNDEADVAAATANVSGDADEPDESSGSSLPSTLVAAGALGLGGVLLLVHRRRRAKQRHRQRGERVLPPGPELQETEEELVDAADEDATLRLDATLRAAAAGAGPEGLPPLRWVETGPQATMLIFESLAPAPEGFNLKPGNRWLSSTGPDDLAVLGEATAPPAPTLVPIGATGQYSEALIELESSGVVTLEGPEEEVRGLLRALALGAASSPWSERTQVVLVGIGGEMTELPWVSQTNLDGALDRAEAHLDQVATALGSFGYETTAQGRANLPQSEEWDPLVIVSAVRPDEADLRRRLRELAALPHRGVSVVTLAPRNAVLPGRSLVIGDDGSLRVDGIDQIVTPRLLDETSSDGLVQLVAQAGHLGEEAFALQPAPGGSNGAHEGSNATARPESGAAPEEPSGPPRLGLDVLFEDVEVLVRVLGEVGAVRRPGLPSEEKLIPSRHKALEAVTYLAARQQPVAPEELERSLYPNDTDPTTRVQATVNAARSLVGDGLVSGPEDGGYLVSEAVTTDYGLFAELTAQADETDDAHRAAWLLTEALDLVRGEPFAGMGRSYAWVETHRETIIAEVVDAAEELAEVRLALGDWRSAEWAARQGLLAFPSDERLYRILMRVAQTAGRGKSGVRKVFDQLCETIGDPKRGVAAEDSLHPETIGLLEELTGADPELAYAAPDRPETTVLTR